MKMKIIHILVTKFIRKLDYSLQYFNLKYLPEFCAPHSVHTGPIKEVENILDLMSKDLAAG